MLRGLSYSKSDLSAGASGLILGSLILKLSLVLGGDTGLLSDGVCQELTADTREPVGEGALGLG